MLNVFTVTTPHWRDVSRVVHGAMPPKRLPKEAYKIGWLCALPTPELQASRMMFDGDEHAKPLTDHGTTSQFVFGEICGHNIVMGCLPSGRYGECSAAAVAADMRSAFTSLRYCVLVGVGGGVPGTGDIRLGDVVVSKPGPDHGGVIEYDHGKALHHGVFERTGTSNSSDPTLLVALGLVESARARQSQFLQFYEECLREAEWQRPEKDQLFASEYIHIQDEDNCERCDSTYTQARKGRSSAAPKVHYGLIASGNQVIKDAEKRDNLSKQYKGICCFEMEAAGIVNWLPCMVVRGICDYSDSHKNKEWQPIAAAAAAAWAKELLRNISPTVTMPGI